MAKTPEVVIQHASASIKQQTLIHLERAGGRRLCVNSWRFGGRPEVGGIAPLAELLAAYAAAGGAAPDPARVRFWQALGSLKWAVMTTMMYASFASGANRSVERAVIGRRLSECEVDLLALMRAGA